MELLDALAAINQPSSIFKTLRCDAGPDSIKRKSYAQTLSSYVTVTFELLNCNVEENYRRLYREFGQTPLSPQPGDATVMNFIPVPVDFVEHDCAGTALDIYMIGAGQSGAKFVVSLFGVIAWASRPKSPATSQSNSCNATIPLANRWRFVAVNLQGVVNLVTAGRWPPKFRLTKPARPYISGFGLALQRRLCSLPQPGGI